MNEIGEELRIRAMDTPEKTRELVREAKVLLTEWEAREGDWMQAGTYQDAAAHVKAKNNKFRITWITAVRGVVDSVLQLSTLPREIRDKLTGLAQEIDQFAQEYRKKQQELNEAVGEKLAKTELCTRFKVCDSNILGGLSVFLIKDQSGGLAANFLLANSPIVREAFPPIMKNHRLLGEQEVASEDLLKWVAGCLKSVDIKTLKEKYLAMPKTMIVVGDKTLQTVLDSLGEK